MAQDIESLNWSSYSTNEWTTHTTKFELTIFKMVLHEQVTSSFLMNLSRAFDLHPVARSKLYSKVFDHWIQLRLLKSVDSNIDTSLELTEYFSMCKLKDDSARQRIKPTLIYSKRLMICFDPIDEVTIYIFRDDGIMQYQKISITVLSLILFTMCKATDVKTLDFSTIEYNDGNPTTLGLKIFSTISKCVGSNDHVSNTQCIVHPINNPFYLQWGKYGFAMMTYVTEMTCRKMKEMLFYDEYIINALTQSEQPFLNRFQILALIPVKPHDPKTNVWLDFHIVLTLSEPHISEALSFRNTNEGHNHINTDTITLLSKLKELPNELKSKVLGEPEEFNDHYCDCSSVKNILTKCLNGEVPKYFPNDDKMSFLFPISIRKRINPLRSKSNDIYLVVRTQFNRELFYPSKTRLNHTFISNARVDKQGSIKLISSNHFNRITYDINDRILGPLASKEDPRTSNHRYDGNYEGRNNPFFRKDSQFK
jgi:hypothetical protein